MNRVKLISIRILFFSLLGISSSCASLATKSINLESLENLNPGISTKKQAIKLLGKPDEITDLSENASSADKKELGLTWKYFEDGSTRLAVFFAPHTDTVDAWTLYLYAKDSEKEVHTALHKFPTARWSSETVKWVNPHSYPYQCFFTDNALGVSLEYNRRREDLSAIYRWNPNRRPAASVENEKPPTFCIENHCSDGILSSILYKDKPLCPIPQF